MCNVNINLTLQFFFPNFFIIYKILTSPFLGYSCRSALYLRDVHQRDVDIFVKPVTFPTIKVFEDVPNTPSDVESEDSDVRI